MTPSQTQRQRTRAAIDARQRRAHLDTCKGCGSAILVGYDGDVCALLARVDATPVGPADELLAHANGRPSYSARPAERGVELNPRDRWSIRGQPRGTNSWPTHLQHDCAEHPQPTPPPTLFDLGQFARDQLADPPF